MRNFQLENVKCENCAKLVKNALRDDFGEVEVDLSQNPRVISLEITPSQIPALKEILAELNFPVIKELWVY